MHNLFAVHLSQPYLISISPCLYFHLKLPLKRKKKNSPEKLNRLSPFLLLCLTNKTSVGLLLSCCTTYPPFEIWRDWDRKSLDVRFIPIRFRKGREGGKRMKKAGVQCVSFPSTATNAHTSQTWTSALIHMHFHIIPWLIFYAWPCCHVCHPSLF